MVAVKLQNRMHFYNYLDRLPAGANPVMTAKRLACPEWKFCHFRCRPNGISSCVPLHLLVSLHLLVEWPNCINKNWCNTSNHICINQIGNFFSCFTKVMWILSAKNRSVCGTKNQLTAVRSAVIGGTVAQRIVAVGAAKHFGEIFRCRYTLTGRNGLQIRLAHFFWL